MTVNINYFKQNKEFVGGLLISVIGLFVSLLGIFNVFSQGLGTTGMTNFVPMGIWLTMYIFFTGLSAGSFIVSTLAYVFNMEKYKPIGRRAVILALILLGNAPIFLLFDLGRPERILNLYLYSNSTSVLSYGSRLILIYPILCLIYLWALTRVDIVYKAKDNTGKWGKLYKLLSLGKTEITEEEAKKYSNFARVLGIIGIPTAIATHGYTGFLFAVIHAHPLWNTPLMPVLFITSAIVSGAALLAVVVMITDWATKVGDTLEPKDYSDLIVTFLFIDIFVLVSELIAVYAANVENEVHSWNLLTRGELAFWFWGVEIIIGVLIPMIIFITPQLRNNKIAVFSGSLMVVLGVFAKRVNLIIGGQMTTTFTRERVPYVPTLTEYLILIGGLSAVVFYFMIFWVALPLGSEPQIKNLELLEKTKSDPSKVESQKEIIVQEEKNNSKQTGGKHK